MTTGTDWDRSAEEWGGELAATPGGAKCLLTPMNVISGGEKCHEVLLRGRWMLVDTGTEYPDDGMLNWGIHYEIRQWRTECHEGWAAWGEWRRVSGLPKPLQPVNKRNVLERELNRRLGITEHSNRKRGSAAWKWFYRSILVLLLLVVYYMF